MSEIKILPFNVDGNYSNIGVAWSKWLQEFQLYCGAKDITKPTVKRDSLLFLGGPYVREVWDSLPESKILYEDRIKKRQDDSIQNIQSETTLKLTKTSESVTNLLKTFISTQVTDEVTKAAHAVQNDVIAALLAAKEADIMAQKKTPGSLQTPDDEYYYIVNALNHYFIPKISNVYQRFLFNQIRPLEGETSCHYLTRLKSKITDCNFSDPDMKLIDMLIVYSSNNELRRELLKVGDTLTLDEAMAIARSIEATDQQARAMESYSPSVTTPIVAKLRVNPFNLRGKCHRCGDATHYANDTKCPARNRTCLSCGKLGHYASVCQTKSPASNDKLTSMEAKAEFKRKSSKPRKKVNKLEEADTDHLPLNESGDDSDASELIFHVKNMIGKIDAAVKATVGGVLLEVLIDSGSTCNVISTSTWKFCKSQNIKCKRIKVNSSVYPYNSITPLPVVEKFLCEVKVGKCSCPAEFYVVQGDCQSLFSINTAKDLHILKLGVTLQQDIQALQVTPRQPEVQPKRKSILQGSSTQNRQDPGSKLKGKILTQFSSVFTGVGKYKDFEISLDIDPAIKPFYQPPRNVPLNLRPELDKKLDELLENKIIEKVQNPSRFVSPLAFGKKPNGDLRVCVDMRRANLAVRRKIHPIPTMEELSVRLRGSTKFSVLDMNSAFHQLTLSPASREITTFITHRGLYRYTVLLFGLNCAPEKFQETMEMVVRDCAGVEVYFDDFLVHGATQKEHDCRLHQLLTKFRDCGLTLNPSKCAISQDEVKFRGHLFSATGIRPLENRVKSMLELRAPKDRNEVASLLGLLTYSSRFLPKFSNVTKPIRDLLKQDIPFVWGEEQNRAFNTIKQLVVKAPALAYFDPEYDTYVVADASPFALGAVLLQNQGDGCRVVEYASRALTDVETRYSQTEREALALVWSCERFHFYLYGGKKFNLVTDHKPLEFIFSVRSKPCARVERWIMRLQCYDFKVVYRPGKTNIADPLSRLLPAKPTPVSTGKEDLFVRWVAEIAVPHAMTIEEIRNASERDTHILKIREALRSDRWNPELKPYEIIKTELCEYDGLVLRGRRILIPGSLRMHIMQLAHEGHQGIVRTKQRLRTKVWWPRMDHNVEKFCRECNGCALVAPSSPPEPLATTKLPEGPWLDLALDYLGPLPNGDYIFVVIDYFSRFFEAIFTRSTSAKTTIRLLRSINARFGRPRSLRSDQAAAFKGDEFRAYCTQEKIKLLLTTPYWPQANGEVERQNRTLLKTLRIAQAQGRDLQEALDTLLLAYRTTPHSATGVSPAKLMYGREIRDKLPEITESYTTDTFVTDNDTEAKGKAKKYTDTVRGAKASNVAVGDYVLIKQQARDKLSTPYSAEPFQVVSKNGNALTVESPAGVTYRRNTTSVRPFYQSTAGPTEAAAVGDLEPSSSPASPLQDVLQEDSSTQSVSEPEIDPGPSDLRQSVRARNPPSWLKDYVT